MLLAAAACGDDTVSDGGGSTSANGGAPSDGGAGAMMESGGAAIGGAGAGGVETSGGGGEGGAAPCPADMALVGSACMDLYEAPNIEGAMPLVMYTLYESEEWCAARGKRLCFDDEWLAACEGASASAYPYGADYQAGACNDEEVWRVYSQNALNGWPAAASNVDIDDLDDLLAQAEAASTAGQVAADEVAELYQAEPSGSNAACAGETGVFDLVGNVEEWTLRADGGEGPDFSGNLKGRYWAESRTCQSNVKVHANAFRFYEIGFRCCADM